MKRIHFLLPILSLFLAFAPPGLFAAPNASAYALDHIYLDPVDDLPKADGDPKFRNRCEIVKDATGNVVSNYIDWIVFPGNPAGSFHRHVYAGAAGTDENTTVFDLKNFPSTCWGGEAIQDAFWTVGLQRQSDNADVNPDHFTIYYARGSGGANWPANAGALLYDLPDHLVAVMGKAMDPVHAQWLVDKNKLMMSCVRATGGVYNSATTTDIPVCDIGDELQIKFVFPACTQGTVTADPNTGQPVVALVADSPNHQDHLAYPQTGDWFTAGNRTTTQCPSTHPYRIPTPVGLWHYTINANSYGPLVPDMGAQLHMDYGLKLQRALFAFPMRDCIRGGKDCGVGLWGNSGLRSKFPGFN